MLVPARRGRDHTNKGSRHTHIVTRHIATRDIVHRSFWTHAMRFSAEASAPRRSARRVRGTTAKEP
jgi:hypothetical protein